MINPKDVETLDNDQLKEVLGEDSFTELNNQKGDEE